MKNQIIEDTFREFILSSEYFEGFVMQGNYDLHPEDFIRAMMVYFDKGINILDDHTIITHYTWNMNNNSDYIITKNEYSNFRRIVNEQFWYVPKRLQAYIKQQRQKTKEWEDKQ